MPRFSFVLAVVCIAAVLRAQSSAPIDNKPSEELTPALCTVTGRVITAVEGNPLKSARVLLIPEHSRSQNQFYAASSDSDGHFILKDVPAGRYQFSAGHSGFVEQHYKAGMNDTAPLFSLRSGEKVSDVLFRLVTAAVITGRVSNEDGDPMQRIGVFALRRPSEDESEDSDTPQRRKMQMEPVASAESDDRGQYRIFGLKPGEYFIKAEDSFQPRDFSGDESDWVKQSLGSEFAAVYYPGVTQVSQAQVVPIKAGEEAQADITMRRVKTVEIVGRAVGSTGPAADAFIYLDPADGTGFEFNRQDTTDEKGNFRLRNIPEGTYYILASQRREGTRVYELRARQKVEVAGENIDGLIISLGGGATIQGRLKLEGPSSVALDRIHLVLTPVDEEGPFADHSEVKKDGTFEFNSIRDGDYAITVWGTNREAYVKSARRGPDDLLEKGLHVEGASGKMEITLSSDSAELEGSVSDDDGPVIGARVRLVPDPLTPYNHIRIQRTNTDQLGHFSLKNLAPGKYKLTAKPMASSESTAYKLETQDVTLSESDHKTMQIKLEKGQQ